MATQRLPRENESYWLRNGDCMIRSEFHRRYSQMPEDYRAELIGGVVFEPSPLSWGHSEAHYELAYLIKTYAMKTAGVSAGLEATIMLSDEDEVQPDLVLLLSEGGQTRLTNKGKKSYVVGAPELVAEIAFSSRAIDLHLKKKRYALAGVLEYIVVCLEPEQVCWFDLKTDAELLAKNKVIRSMVFPGLWLHTEALLKLNSAMLLSTLEEGFNSEEYRNFAKVRP